MEHFDLEDMFGRRKKPKLSLFTRIMTEPVSTGPGGILYGYSVILGIKNDGRGMARFPNLTFSLAPTPPYRIIQYGLNGNGQNGLPQRIAWDQPMICLAGGSDHVIHANTVLEITKTDQINIHETRLETPPADLIIKYQITAQDAKMIDASETILGETALAEISKMAEKRKSTT